MIYRYKFWDPIYFGNQDSIDGLHFPSQSNECKGRMVGFSESVGHKMTYKILTDDTNQIIFRSCICLAVDSPNLRLDPPSVDASVAPVPTDPSFSPRPSDVIHFCSRDSPMATFDPDELIGCSFLTPPKEDGSRSCLRIVKLLDDHDATLAQSPAHVRFRATNWKSSPTMRSLTALKLMTGRTTSGDSIESSPIKDHLP